MILKIIIELCSSSMKLFAIDTGDGALGMKSFSFGDAVTLFTKAM